MSQMTDDELEAVDVAVVAYRLEGEWHVQDLNESAVESIESIVEEMRRYPSESGTIAMLSIDEDFVIIVRVDGHETRVLLSDASAATDWELARSALARTGVHVTDLDEQVPAGDLDIVEDLGMPADEMSELLDDYELFPEEVLSEIADAVGFGPEFDDLVGVDS